MKSVGADSRDPMRQLFSVLVWIILYQLLYPQVTASTLTSNDGSSSEDDSDSINIAERRKLLHDTEPLRSYHQMKFECRCLLESSGVKSLFHAAQRELQQPPPTAAASLATDIAIGEEIRHTGATAVVPAVKRFKFLDYFHDRFFRSDQGTDVFSVRGKVLANVVMYKVNSEGIFASLQQAETPVREAGIDLAQQWDRKKEVFTAFSAQQLQDKISALAANNNMSSSGSSGSETISITETSIAAMNTATVFAFVRDPLQHFISGVVESHFRRLGFGAHPADEAAADYQNALLLHRANATVAAAAVAAIARGDRLSMDELLVEREHFFPLTFALLKWRPAFVGRLESLEEDWKKLQQFAGILPQSAAAAAAATSTAPVATVTSNSVSSSNSGSGAIVLQRAAGHPTEQDVLRMKASLQQLFDQDKRYLRAVCRLLLVDYHCLQYVLPQPCRDMRIDPHWLQFLNKCK